jgi:hypothetical protein
MHVPCLLSLLADKLGRKFVVRRLLFLERVRKAKERDVNHNKNEKNGQPGDILGISNPGGPKLPHPPSDGSTPQGIEVRGERPRHWGNEDIPQSDGAAGIDMGAGGDGTHIAPKPTRPQTEDER